MSDRPNLVEVGQLIENWLSGEAPGALVLAWTHLRYAYELSNGWIVIRKLPGHAQEMRLKPGSEAQRDSDRQFAIRQVTQALR